VGNTSKICEGGEGGNGDMRAAGLFGLNTGCTRDGIGLGPDVSKHSAFVLMAPAKKTEASEFLGPGAPNLTLRSLEFRVIA
jgi:hypothetical protein